MTTAAGSVDLVIEGAHGRATRIPRRTYRDTEPDIVDVWVIDAPDMLAPFTQFAVSVADVGRVGYMVKIAPVAPDDPARPAEGSAGGWVGGPIATHTFHTDHGQVARDVCKMLAQGLVDGRLPIAMGARTWELVLAATVHLANQVHAEQATAAGMEPLPLPDWERDVIEKNREAFDRERRQGFEAGHRHAEFLLQPVRVERDHLREWRTEILAALDDADPVKYPEPASAVQRIRALGDRARQITDIHAGAVDRLAEPAKPTHPVDLLARMGGAYAVVADVITERKRAEVIFPDQHLPDGTGGPVFTIAAERFRAECDKAMRDGILTWRHVVLEEVYEAMGEPPARADNLRAELVQAAAMFVRWVEDIDLRAAGQADAA